MSTEPTIEMMNVVIAKFMGYYYQAGKFYSNTVYPGRGNWFKHAKYDTSWDWLMPVVIRIKNDESLRLKAPCLGIPDSIWPYINAMKEMNKRLLKADITGTHAGVYQFIQWYNQQKQTNDERGTNKG